MTESRQSCIELLDSERFIHFWPGIEAELDTKPHIWSDHWTKEAIRDMTLMGRFQCWAAGDSKTVKLILFTQVGIYASGNILQVLLAFGNSLDEMLPDIEATIERFAMNLGCRLMEVSGRPGWGPKLRRMGWKQSTVTMKKRVTGRMN